MTENKKKSLFQRCLRLLRAFRGKCCFSFIFLKMHHLCIILYWLFATNHERDAWRYAQLDGCPFITENIRHALLGGNRNKTWAGRRSSPVMTCRASYNVYRVFLCNLKSNKSLRKPQVANRTAITRSCDALCIQLFELLRGMDSIMTFRFLRCRGVLALISSPCWNTNYRQIKSNKLKSSCVQPKCTAGLKVESLSWMRAAHWMACVVLSKLKFSSKPAESVWILSAEITTFWHF